MTQEVPKTVQDAIEIAAQYGIELTQKDIDDAYEIANANQRQLEAQSEAISANKLREFVDRFNRFYPRFLQTLLGIGDVLITMTQTVLIAFGVPGLLIMLLIVEQQRVDHGIGLFEVSPELTAFCATALVLGNLLFELLISWKENQAGYTEPPKFEFSLRILAGRVAYMFGRSTAWKPRPKSPAQRFKGVLRVITFTILVLALAGSMRTVIEQTTGNWSDAIRYVLTQSTLLQAVTWLGGLLFAVAAVLSAQAISQYVAQKVIEIVAIMQSSTEDKPRAMLDATGMTAAAFLMSRITERRKMQRRAAVAAVVMPRQSEEVFHLRETPETQTVSQSVTDDVSDEMKHALQWLRNNPKHGLSHRKAAPLAGVSESTMWRAIQRNKKGI